jgi:hypothetical protein
MPLSRKSWKKVQGNVHTGTLGRVTNADLPNNMYLGPQNRIAGMRTPQRSDIPHLAFPTGNEVKKPNIRKVSRLGR